MSLLLSLHILTVAPSSFSSLSTILFYVGIHSWKKTIPLDSYMFFVWDIIVFKGYTFKEWECIKKWKKEKPVSTETTFDKYMFQPYCSTNLSLFHENIRAIIQLTLEYISSSKLRKLITDSSSLSFTCFIAEVLDRRLAKMTMHAKKNWWRAIII